MAKRGEPLFLFASNLSSYINTLYHVEADLDEDTDLGDVYEALIGIKHIWYVLGLQLGLRTKTLEGIKAQYPQFEAALLEMLKQWLKQIEKPRTWKAMVRALRQKSVNEEETAREIEMKYLNKESQSGNV